MFGVAVVVVIVAAGAALAYDQWVDGDDTTPNEPASPVDAGVDTGSGASDPDGQPSTAPILGPVTVESPNVAAVPGTPAVDKTVVDEPVPDDQIVVPLEQPAAPPIEAPRTPAPVDAGQTTGDSATEQPAPEEVPAPPLDSAVEPIPAVGSPASGGLESPVRVGNAIDSATEVVDAVNDRLPDDALVDQVLDD